MEHPLLKKIKEVMNKKVNQAFFGDDLQWTGYCNVSKDVTITYAGDGRIIKKTFTANKINTLGFADLFALAVKTVQEGPPIHLHDDSSDKIQDSLPRVKNPLVIEVFDTMPEREEGRRLKNAKAEN